MCATVNKRSVMWCKLEWWTCEGEHVAHKRRRMNERARRRQKNTKYITVEYVESMMGVHIREYTNFQLKQRDDKEESSER